MAFLLDDRNRSCRGTWPRPTGVDHRRGSILLLTVLLLGLLSVLFLLTTNSILLGTMARESLQDSVEMFYIAEAGLSHGQAFCAAHGETSSLLAGEHAVEASFGSPAVAPPFGSWFPLGRGEYHIEVFPLSRSAQPYIERDSGILLVATARLGGTGQARVCLLMDPPPTCQALAWWEPE